MPDGPEHREQVLLFSWIRSLDHLVAQTAYAVPNGALDSKDKRIYFTAEGVLPGITDVCIPYPVGEYAALYVELKAGAGMASDNQIRVMNRLAASGNRCVIAWTALAAAELIAAYLRGELCSDFYLEAA